MTDQSPQAQVESIIKAFEQDIERFASFIDDPSALSVLSLDDAISEQRSVAELRTRYLGKKSALAATKKLIGRIPPEERAGFGQFVQATEDKLETKLVQIELSLGHHIEEARTAR